MRACIVVRKSDPSSAVGFPNFLEDNCQTKNGCVSLRIDYSALFKWYDSSFSEKNRRSFAWKCFVRKQLLLDLAHLETPIQWTAVYFRAYTRKSTIHHLSRCHRRVSKHRERIFGAFLSTNRHEPFFERLKNCVGSNANKFLLTVKYSCNIECVLIPLMPKVVSISR